LAATLLLGCAAALPAHRRLRGIASRRCRSTGFGSRRFLVSLITCDPSAREGSP
jgi:hypothetical protein